MANLHSSAEIQSASGILNLPDEVLLDILCLATSFGSRDLILDPSSFVEISSVSKTCRRFHSLLTPIMYNEMDFTVGTYDKSLSAVKMPLARVQKLLWTLQQNPGVGRHFRTVSVTLNAIAENGNAENGNGENGVPLVDDEEGYYEEDYEVEEDDPEDDYLVTIKLLLNLLTGTKKLSVSGNFNYKPEVWQDIGAAILNMPHLEEIDLWHSYPGIAHGPVCEVLSQAGSLKCLEVHGIVDTSRVDSSGVPMDRQHSLKRLAVTSIGSGPDSVRRLISWPCELEHLHLDSPEMFGGGNRSHWGLRDIGPVLKSQKTTLRTLEIRRLDIQGIRHFDLTMFESLEELRISYFSTGCKPGTEAKLLAPKLRKFFWVFEGGWRAPLTNFEEQHENWLREFATGAVARRLPLSEIHLRFRPDHDIEELITNPPWDRIERLQAEFSDMGITLSCPVGRKHYETVW